MAEQREGTPESHATTNKLADIKIEGAKTELVLDQYETALNKANLKSKLVRSTQSSGIRKLSGSGSSGSTS